MNILKDILEVWEFLIIAIAAILICTFPIWIMIVGLVHFL